MQAEHQASLRSILAIDTCGKRPGVALAVGGKVFDSEPGDANARADRVAAVAGELLAAAGIGVGDLSGLAVTIGPGSYTGVRIGLALVRGLSLVDETPVVAIGSLELLALAASKSPDRACALLDAGNDSFYAAVYDREADTIREILPPRLVARADLAVFLQETGGSPCIVRCEGEGDVTLDARVTRCFAPASRTRRLAEIALARLAAGRTRQADSVMPLYVGTSSARPNRNKVVATSRACE